MIINKQLGGATGKDFFFFFVCDFFLLLFFVEVNLKTDADKLFKQ